MRSVSQSISRSPRSFRANVNCREFPVSRYRLSPTTSGREKKKNKREETIGDDKSSRPRRDGCYKRLSRRVAAIEIARLIPAARPHAHYVLE